MFSKITSFTALKNTLYKGSLQIKAEFTDPKSFIRLAPGMRFVCLNDNFHGCPRKKLCGLNFAKTAKNLMNHYSGQTYETFYLVRLSCLYSVFYETSEI